MVYQRNQPDPQDDLDVSAPILQANTNAADTSFGVDHYPFSDLTENNGYHNKITQPIIQGGAHPTTEGNPILYTMRDCANFGALQYSRGVNNAVPTPITSIYSSPNPLSIPIGGTIDILDFNGASRCSLFFSIYDYANATWTTVLKVIWSGTVGGEVYLSSSPILPSPKFIVNFSGSVLRAGNNTGQNLNNTFWEIEFSRIG